jgi:ABC-type nitrate/sulfonate/bicarbonate transport system substrate-binding protein
MDSIGMPTWLRIVLIAGVVVLVTGTGLFAYRWYYRPTTLTISVGSLDGEAGRIMSAIAGRLAATNAGVRLNVMETSSALEAANAFSSGKTDLAVVRGDVGDLSQAQAVIVVAHAVALLIGPPGSSMTDITDLKRSVVGVIGGETNRKIVRVLTDEYDLTRASVTFKDLAPSDARRALESKQVRAVLIVVPLAEKYLRRAEGHVAGFAACTQ